MLTTVLHSARENLPLLAVFLVGVGVWLRVSGLYWDEGALLHADERYLEMVMSALHWPGSLREYFASQVSPLNPFNLSPRLNLYVYGTLPLFLGKAFAGMTAFAGIADPLVATRLLSALADTGTLLVVFILGRDIFGYRTGLAAAVLYGFAVLPIQLAHFFTVDPFLNLFLVLSLLQCLRLSENAGVRPAVLLGLFWGCALASKLSAALFFPVILLATVFCLPTVGVLRTALRLLIALLASLLVFRLLQPYAFDGWLTLDTRFTDALKRLADLQDSEYVSPPSLQWLDRAPLLFPLHNMAQWGLGLALFSAGAAGAVLTGLRLTSRLQPGPALLLGWLVLQLAVVALAFNPTLRYLLPAYPLMAVFAATFLLSLGDAGGRRRRSHWPLLLVVAATLLWALAFTAVYRTPTTRVEASRWLHAHVPAGAVLGVERWDEALPVVLRDLPRDRYRQREMRLFAPPSPAKREALLADLAAVDYVIVGSSRGYGALTRLPQQFPLAARYYELLFGSLAGFELAAEFTDYPRLPGVTIADDAAEEAFTVHDHPRVLIYRKTAAFSVASLREALAAVQLPAARESPVPPRVEASAEQRPVTRGGLHASGNAQWLYLLHWVALLWLAGIVGSALARRLLPGAEVSGVSFPGRLLVLVPAAWLFALGLRSDIVQMRDAVWLTVLLVAAALGVLYSNRTAALKTPPRLAMECVFWGSFAFFLLLRFHNPAIAWGERPMDFAILNAFLRTETLPPQDPWFAGFPLQYHAWGQYFMSVLGTMAGTPPALLYNLAAALPPAFAAELIFWIVYRVSAAEQRRLWPAFLAVAAVLFTGNLSFWSGLPGDGAVSFMDFWDASRIVPGTINEFPFWTAVFGDLHSHFIGLVFSALFLAAFLLWHGQRAGLPGALLLALSLAGLALTNVWATPVYALLLVLGALMQPRGRDLLVAALIAVLAAAMAWPFWSAPAQRASFDLVRDPVSLKQGLILFAPFFIVIGLWTLSGMKSVSRQWSAGWLATLLVIAALVVAPQLRTLCAVLLVLVVLRLYPQPRSPRTEFTGLLALCGLLVLLGSEVFTLSDRMNTVFKYQFEAWVLLALAAALALEEVARGRRVTLLLALVLLAGLPTSLYALQAWWRNPKVDSPATLDGLAYLRDESPDEAKVVAWLNQQQGQPVLLEATGPVYGDYGRMSAFTGLPVLLGWDYHVWQHGHDWGTINAREEQVRAAYLSLSGAEAVKETGVDYAVLCPLERETYGDEAGRYWSRAGWRPVFRAGECAVWQVDGDAARDY